MRVLYTYYCYMPCTAECYRSVIIFVRLTMHYCKTYKLIAGFCSLQKYTRVRS